MQLPTPSWQAKPLTKNQAATLFQELLIDQEIRSLTNEEQYWFDQYLIFLRGLSQLRSIHHRS